ncbi:galactokinase [Bipolaris maydis]|nr:galactokinase [Bipolaris maydis]
MDPPNLGALHLSDSDTDGDALFDTPAARKTNKTKDVESEAEGTTGSRPRAKESHYTAEEAREEALRRELESIRNVNKVIEGVIESLQKAKDNMATVARTVQNASTLLQTWTRILSQTEHNQRLILNPQWQGASQDLVDIEEEQAHRQQAAQRRAAEEQARREAAARKIEEDRQRAEAAAKPGTRGRGRGRPRGASTSSTGNYVGIAHQTTSTFVNMEVPTASSLRDIYPEDAFPVETKRWDSLLARFKDLYGKQADFVARSPGRVNIIGEHIDYSLYEVLPMAITADFIMAVAVRPCDEKPRVRIANLNSEKFPTREFDIPEGEIPIDATEHEWTNYFKSGLKGVTQLLQKKRGKFTSVGMDIVCDGTVPSGGGLSSSASVVCTSALAVLSANGEQNIDKTELCELAIVSERSVGVNSGGMDQAASVFSLRGSALYVSFKPSLKCTNIEFPQTNPELAFVTAQSFVAADKHVTAPVCYNLRVVECTLAAVFLAKAFGLKKPLPTDSSPLGVSLRGFHDTYFEDKEGVADNTKISVAEFETQLTKLIQHTENYLPQEEGYTREQISGLLGISVDELNQRYMSKFPVRADKFMLRQRALHVFTEALRVIKFRSLLASPPSKDKDYLQSLGDLMNTTQDSCREIYDCSCPELDELCDLARAAGSCGSRLTGAGWGGCSVHLVPKDKVEAVKKAWVDKYYKKRFPDITEEKLAQAIVVSEPGSGSMLFKLTGEKLG